MLLISVALLSFTSAERLRTTLADEVLGRRKS